MIANVRPYRGTRESGVSWLGEVPDHWHVVPGRACYRERSIPNIGMRESQVLSLSFGRIVLKPEDRLHGLVPESFETYQIVEPGDIVVRPTDLQNDWNSLRFALSPHRGIITSAYMCLRTQGEMSRDYGYFLLHAYDLKKVFYGLGSGLRQNLDWDDFKYLPCIVPPVDEQDLIVRFLEYADRRTRRAINAKQKLIALLNEQKQAVIHHAVTRGLDPNVQFKPSGIRGFGEMPAHWSIRRAKYVFFAIDARTATGVEDLLTVSARRGVVPRSEQKVSMFKAESYVGHKLCWPRDLVINSLWAWANGLGFARQHGIVSTAYGVYRLRDRYADCWGYLDRALRSGAYQWEFQVRSKGIWLSRLQLTDSAFLDIPLVLPPPEEARAIAECLDDDVAAADKAIATAEREIDLLGEYRTRLIADVVTGKLDVRAAAARLPDEVDEPEPLDEIDVEESEASEEDDLQAVEA